MKSQSNKIPDIVKLKPMKRGVNDSRNVKALPNDDMQKKMESKSKWAVNFFNSWIENRKSKNFVCDFKSIQKKGDISVEIPFL